MSKKRLFQSDLKKRALPRNVDMYVAMDKKQNFRIYGRLFRSDLKITWFSSNCDVFVYMAKSDF